MIGTICNYVWGKLLAAIWFDDFGAMLSVEYVLLGSITVLGLTAGAIEVRTRVNSGLQQIGENVVFHVPVTETRLSLGRQPAAIDSPVPTVPTVIQLPPVP
jgi:hypothetical protein